MTDQLEQVLVRFVDHVMTGQLDAARQDFADAQAHGLANARTPAELWAALQHHAAQQLPDDLDETDGEIAMRRLSRSGAT